MNTFWEKIFLGNSIIDWAIAISIIIGSIILLRLIKTILFSQFKKWSKKTNTTIDDFLLLVTERSILPFFYLLAVYSGLSYLSLGEKTQNILRIALLVAGTFFGIRLITSLIRYAVENFTRSQHDIELKKKQARGIIIIINILVWIMGIVFVIDNLGYDITTLVAGLGIGGIAIALAAQAVLGDLFSYFVIFFDKPFEIGDFIIVGDKMGTVEYVGIKTTRIRALSGEQLIMANTDLTNSRVQNYKRMEKRRVVFSIGVLYETPVEKIKMVPGIVKKIIEDQSELQFDRVHFFAFGNFSLNFEIVYYVSSADYNLYMDKQQTINLAIFEEFKKEHIEFAYPTQRIYLDNGDNVTGRTMGETAYSESN
ncbi:MAG TPA: mechanosensitive ion channel domain-containing protein [Chitinophagaceae bacterium]|nr:mechanosensitive ion channel domain-containing protein [Chitinophagaceae bacterium]